jgi:hypothetical protein
MATDQPDTTSMVQTSMGYNQLLYTSTRTGLCIQHYTSRYASDQLFNTSTSIASTERRKTKKNLVLCFYAQKRFLFVCLLYVKVLLEADPT